MHVFYKCARPYCMAYFSSVADLPSVSLLFLFEVIPYTGARTLDGFVEFLEQSLKTPSTVSFITFLPNLSTFALSFLGGEFSMNFAIDWIHLLILFNFVL